MTFRPQPIIHGAMAGFIATGPMTVAMMIMYRRLGVWERYPLPPRQITEVLVGQRHDPSTAKGELNESVLTGLTLASHFLYGAAAGGVFATLERFFPAPKLMKGIAFGLVVWTASYLAWIPALGILRPATEHPPRRSMLMIAAHVVWGAVTGLMLDHLEHGLQIAGIGRFEDR